MFTSINVITQSHHVIRIHKFILAKHNGKNKKNINCLVENEMAGSDYLNRISLSICDYYLCQEGYLFGSISMVVSWLAG